MYIFLKRGADFLTAVKGELVQHDLEGRGWGCSCTNHTMFAAS
jgi:hypothetical protein